MTVDAASKAINQQWFDYIKSLAGDAAGGSRIVFPCIRDTRAPLAGRGVPEPVTNDAMYVIGNSLLTEDNVWYTPSRVAGYIEEQQTYLNHVVLNCDSSADKLSALATAKKDMDDNARDFRKTNAAARKEWRKSQKDESSNFNAYILQSYPELPSARDRMQSSANAYNTQYAAVYGRSAAQLNIYRNRLNTILANLMLPGYTMQAIANHSLFSLESYIDDLRAGNPSTATPVTAGVIDVASYRYDPAYADTLDQWNRDFPTSGYNHMVEFTSDTGNNARYQSKNERSIEAEASFGLFCWLRIKYTDNEEWSNSTATSKKGRLTVKFETKHQQVFTIAPGNWDVPGYRRLFPNVSDDLPKRAEKTVKPISMICASGVKYTIKFENEARETFDGEYEKVRKASGRLSIFGIDVGVSYAPNKDKDGTHKASYDKDKGELTVEPTAYAGTCTLLAMIGVKTDAEQ
ncbi:hypothetical protein F5Y10DRAFT_253008 [Nemania abortiva]|nr:hypothetical protein F5Y10DRAFT_253008 [Nemania abortiva]